MGPTPPGCTCTAIVMRGLYVCYIPIHRAKPEACATLSNIRVGVQHCVYPAITMAMGVKEYTETTELLLYVQLGQPSLRRVDRDDLTISSKNLGLREWHGRIKVDVIMIAVAVLLLLLLLLLLLPPLRSPPTCCNHYQSRHCCRCHCRAHRAAATAIVGTATAVTVIAVAVLLPRLQLSPPCCCYCYHCRRGSHSGGWFCVTVACGGVCWHRRVQTAQSPKRKKRHRD